MVLKDKGNNSISLIFTNDIKIELIPPPIFWNFSKKNGGNKKYFPFLDYVKVPKIERRNKSNYYIISKY